MEANEGSTNNEDERRNKVGRPALDITRENLVVLQKKGFTAKEMAQSFGCSQSLIYTKLQTLGLQQRKKYSSISHDELLEVVSRIHKDFPAAGEKMMHGYLLAEGIYVQRKRVRETLSSLADRMEKKKPISRRVYKVPTPNSLWHMDGHMKLARWGITTHGCVDGFSRCIVYLHASLNNRAPTGRSVHNQRIERLWRDVHTQVTSFFYSTFYALEDSGKLDINNQNDMLALHFVYLPEINRRLSLFHSSWNQHSIRTEGNQTPEQLFITGTLTNSSKNSSAIQGILSQEFSLKEQLKKGLNEYGLSLDDFPNTDIPDEDDAMEQLQLPDNVIREDMVLDEKFEAVKMFLYTSA